MIVVFRRAAAFVIAATVCLLAIRAIVRQELAQRRGENPIAANDRAIPEARHPIRLREAPLPAVPVMDDPSVRRAGNFENTIGPDEDLLAPLAGEWESAIPSRESAIPPRPADDASTETTAERAPAPFIQPEAPVQQAPMSPSSAVRQPTGQVETPKVAPAEPLPEPQTPSAPSTTLTAPSSTGPPTPPASQLSPPSAERTPGTGDAIGPDEDLLQPLRRRPTPDAGAQSLEANAGIPAAPTVPPVQPPAGPPSSVPRTQNPPTSPGTPPREPAETVPTPSGPVAVPEEIPSGRPIPPTPPSTVNPTAPRRLPHAPPLTAPHAAPHAPHTTSVAPPPSPPGVDPHAEVFSKSPYPSAKECRSCHEQIYEEWASSSHAYASISPMFRKFEQTIHDLSQGTISAFCVRCHAPVATSLEHPRDASIWESVPAATEGVTCIACHRVVENYGKVNGERRMEMGDLSDPMVGSGYGEGLQQVLANKQHYKVKTRGDTGPGQQIHEKVIHFEQISSSHFCVSCHQVAVSPGIALEVVWAQYRASPACKQGITCQECHMGGSRGWPWATTRDRSPS